MYMRASGASDLRNFSHFHILELLFLSIFCWYLRNFVGTNNMLVGLHVPTNFQMYRQNSEKSMGGGGNSSGYAKDDDDVIIIIIIITLQLCTGVQCPIPKFVGGGGI